MATDLKASLVLQIRQVGAASLRSVKTEIEGLSKSSEKLKKAIEFGANAKQFAGTMDEVRGAAVSVFKTPIDKFAEFEFAMARAKSKMDDLSANDFAQMKKAALEAGSSTSFSASQAADGLGEMAAAGFTVKQQIAALPKVLQLAQAGEVGVGEATKIAASAMAQFGLGAADITDIGNTLLKASNASTIGLGEIAESLKYVGPVAAASGLKLKETATFVALLGNAGIESSSAGTALRGMLASMAAPSGKAKKALAEVHMTTKDLAKGVQDPISVLKQLGEQFDKKKLTQAQRLSVVMRVFGRETSAAVMSLIDAGNKAGEGGTAFEKMSAAMRDTTGAMDAASRALGDTTVAKMKRLDAQIDALKISAGEKMAPALLGMAEDAKPWLTRIGEGIESHPLLTRRIGETAVAVAGIATVLKGAALGAGFFGSNIRGGELALKALRAPGRVAVDAIKAVDTAALSLTDNLGKTAVAATRVFGAAGAFAAGYEIGGMIDGLVGGLLELRGGLLSTELALRAGEASNANQGAQVSSVKDVAALEKAGKAGEGFQTAQQAENWRKFMDFFTAGAYSGNERRNANERDAARNGHAQDVTGGARAPLSPEVGVDSAQFNAVTGQIEVRVTDDRVAVRTISKGPVRLRRGATTPAGAR